MKINEYQKRAMLTLNKELDKKDILNVPSIMEMISYYFEKEEFSKSSKIFKDKNRKTVSDRISLIPF